MDKYIVKFDGERIDNIVFNHYGSLDIFADVLSVNKNIKPTQKKGDIIYLPAKKEVKDSGATLW